MDAADECLNTLKKIQALEQELLRSTYAAHRGFDAEDVQRGADAAIFSHRGQSRSHLMELSVVDAVNTFFSMVSEEKPRRLVFERLFVLPNGGGGWSHERQTMRVSFLARMTSVAISTWLSPPLEFVALWLRRHTGAPLRSLTRTVTEDILSIDRPAKEALRELPRSNLNFVEAYITAVTDTYTFQEAGTTPPVELLALILTWISEYKHLLRCTTGSSGSGTRSRSALFGLARWTVTAALHLTSTKQSQEHTVPAKRMRKEKSDDNSNDNDENKEPKNMKSKEDSNPNTLVAKLHLKLLAACESLSPSASGTTSDSANSSSSSASTTPLHQAELLEFIAEITRITHNIQSKSGTDSDKQDRIELALSRLAQIVQITWMNSLLNANRDALRTGLNTLPSSRSISMVIERLH